MKLSVGSSIHDNEYEVKVMTKEDYYVISKCGARPLFDISVGSKIYRFLDCISEDDKRSYLILEFADYQINPINYFSLELEPFYSFVAIKMMDTDRTLMNIKDELSTISVMANQFRSSRR